jgi:hypothetical protein
MGLNQLEAESDHYYELTQTITPFTIRPTNVPELATGAD